MQELDEPIEIAAYDPTWTEIFRSAADELRAQLGKMALAIEHIGSTAVPGLRGKPVIDIMIGVEPDILREEMLRQALVDYESLGEAGVQGRLYFRKRQPAAVNLHAVVYRGGHWNDNLLLRDYLRARPAESERYGRAKQAIFESGCHTLLAYSEAKRVIVQDLLLSARAWNLSHEPIHHT